jgi:hypothetical protein
MSHFNAFLDAVRVRAHGLVSTLSIHIRAFARSVKGSVWTVRARPVIGPVVEAVADIAAGPRVRTAAKTVSLMLVVGIGVWTVPGAVVAAVAAVARVALLLVAMELWLRWSTGSRPVALRRAFRTAAATGLLWTAAGLFSLANAVLPPPQAPFPSAATAVAVGALDPGVDRAQVVPPADPRAGRADRRARGRESARDGLA